jgi:hypothetical protein
MKLRKCDKCGAEIDYNKRNDMLSLFDGSLDMEDVDLCPKHWQELQEIIEKFGERKK